MTLFNLKDLLKDPTPKAITLGVRAFTYESGAQGNSVHGVSLISSYQELHRHREWVSATFLGIQRIIFRTSMSNLLFQAAVQWEVIRTGQICKVTIEGSRFGSYCVRFLSYFQAEVSRRLLELGPNQERVCSWKCRFWSPQPYIYVDVAQINEVNRDDRTSLGVGLVSWGERRRPCATDEH